MTTAASVRAALLAAALGAGGACAGDRQPVVVGSAAPEPGGSAPAPLDRLAPGELPAGTQKVYGLAIPRDMQVDRTFEGVSHVVGDVKAEAVANYVRKRVTVAHVEIAAGRTVFPRARINGDSSGKLFQIDVTAEPGKTRMVVRDLTPPPTEQGLSEAERWKRAGFTPDGKPIDPKQMK